MAPCCWLPLTKGSATEQIKASLALLEGMGATDGLLSPKSFLTLRWYQVALPTLVLGHGQQQEELDLAACTAKGIEVCRRASGGTAVLVGPGDLMLDVALPKDHHLYTTDVTESYRWLGEVWVTTLRELGLKDAKLISVAEARADAQTLPPLLKRVCFAGLSPYEVGVGEQKVIGLAQVRKRYGCLLQAGLSLLRWEPQQIVDLLNISATEKREAGEALAKKVAGLGDLLPTFTEVEPTANAVMQVFTRHLVAKLSPS